MPYIIRCLESLEAQTIKDFDVFLINDCSTDKTEDVILQYSRKSHLNLHYIVNDVNVGPSKSREKAISQSDSEFICFCDSDDWYETNFVEEMLNRQSENDADIVFCAHKLVFNSGKCATRDLSITKDDLKEKKAIIVKSPDSLCMMMTRRNLFNRIQMPDLRNGEDMAIVPILVSLAKNINVTGKHLYNYYCRPGSASQSANADQIQSLIKSYQYINSNLSNSFFAEKEFLGVRNLLYGALINLFKFSSEYEKADQILNSFEEVFPKWEENYYILLLSYPKRLFLKLIKRRNYLLASILSYVHKYLIS